MKTHNECFYCGALISAKGEEDHFPLPKASGGESMVLCCQTCHDMKDRFPLDQWPEEWVYKVMQDLPRVGRETKIFLAKAIRLLADANRVRFNA